MEPLNEKIVRPRLSIKEIGILALLLEDFVKQHEKLKDDKAIAWIKQLQRRFQRLEEGKGFLRPRR
jgi:hypothetical protein